MRAAEEIIELLEQKGFDTKQGLQICIDDADIYMEVLETALEEGRTKVPLIRECAEKKDYDRYLIETHGLKNAAKSIGAMELSKLAYEQEMAVREGNCECMEQEAAVLCSRYEEVLDLLEELLK